MPTMLRAGAMMNDLSPADVRAELEDFHRRQLAEAGNVKRMEVMVPVQPAATTFFAGLTNLIGLPDEGYVWSLKLVAANLAASGSLAVFKASTSGDTRRFLGGGVTTPAITTAGVQDGANSTIAAATAGSVSLPNATDLLTGFNISLSTVGTAAMTVTVSNVQGGPYVYTILTGGSGLTVTYPTPLRSTGSAPNVAWSSTASAVGNVAVFGQTAATTQAAGGTSAAVTWSSDQAELKHSEGVYLVASQNMVEIFLAAEQVTAEKAAQIYD